MSQLTAVKVEKERSWVQVEEKQETLQPVLCFSLFRKCSLVWCHCWSQVFTSFLCSREWEILVPSDEHLVLEKFVGGCSGSKDGLRPTPFTFNSILLPFLALESGISLYAKGISSCLPLSGSDMGHRTIVLCFPNKPGQEKHWQFEWAYLCLHWNMDFSCSGLCICVFDAEGGSVGSGHAWIVALFSSIVQSQQWSVRHSRKHLSLLQHIKEDDHLLCFTAQGYHKVNSFI